MIFSLGGKYQSMQFKFFLYLIGCLLFSIGATLFITSNLGTDPLDVFSIGIKNCTGAKIGTVQSLFAIVCLVIWSSINNWKFPPLYTFLTFFICGYLIDFFLLFSNLINVNHWGEMLMGVACCTEGSALIIMSTFGIRAMDLVAISLAEKTNKPFWIYKAIAETLLLTTGYLLGGPIGIGTIFFLFFVGWLIQPFISFNNYIVHKFFRRSRSV